MTNINYKNKKEIKDILIKDEFDFMNLPHNELLSHTFDSIKCNHIHFQNINFNTLSTSILRKLDFKEITFDNCIMGNLNYLNMSIYYENYKVNIINQEIDNYTIKILETHELYLENNNINELSLFNKSSYSKIAFINNNLKGILHTIKFKTPSLMLDSIDNYTISDLEFISDKIKNKHFVDVYFGSKKITTTNINSIIRKIKIHNLINDNA